MSTVAWTAFDHPVDYTAAVAAMEARAAAIAAGCASEAVWLLEHPPLYTAGTSAKADDLIAPDRFPVYKTGRGGQYTYHGPGQRVAYAMLDLRHRGRDVRAYVHHLEDWVIAALDSFGIEGERREGRVGVWVRQRGGGEAKIAAIGVRVRRWISFHGISLNVEPDLSHFTGIVPCGIAGYGVTSLVAEGRVASMAEADAALERAFNAVFGGTVHVPVSDPALSALAGPPAHHPALTPNLPAS